MRATLIVMGKPPLMGRAKTRLARDVGPVAAMGFARHAARRLLHRLPDPRRWDTVLAVNALPRARYAAWPREMRRMPQGRGDLGDRLLRVMGEGRRGAPGPIVIIGTDTPHIEPEDIAAAFGALNRGRVVVGPARDGGFWLIGFSRREPLPDLFEGVRWSTDTTLRDTLRSLPPGVSVTELETLEDVDDLASWRRVERRRGRFRTGRWRRPERPVPGLR